MYVYFYSYMYVFLQLFHKPFTKKISRPVHNSNAFRDFLTNMFYMVFPCKAFVNENT